jgi:hypothetical protein
LWKRDDGMTAINGLLDPLSAALVRDAFDRVTMPRRAGVRFVDPLEQQRREDAMSDTRSIEQLMADAFVEMVKTAAAADKGKLFGSKTPAVRLHVRASDVRNGEGAAYAEGQDAPVSIGTVHKLICDGGVIPILFDDNGEALRVGRTQRLFTEKQRIAIAARDGGCMAPDCDRPPSWTEAHHATPWDNGGLTDIDCGIAFCTHHHLWLHNTGAHVYRQDGEWWLQPGDGSPPIQLRSKHPLQQTG